MKFTLFQLWSHMGFGARLISATMLLMSLAVAVLAVERAIKLLRSNRQSIRFASQLAELLRDGDVERAAQAQLPADSGHLGRVLSAAFRAYRSCPREDEDLTFESVARVLERQGQREVHNMRRGIGALATIASTAPFVGLLGTVLGIVNAFEMMAESGAGGLSVVSAGIAEALATTALGLLVAIPAVGIYNALQAFVDARAVDIAEASNELLELLARHLRAARAPQQSRDRADRSVSFRPRESVAPQR
jgi:biopolymer transport protein ExbB/biopolymer transport protein TolQ